VLLSQPRHLGDVKVIDLHVGIIVGLDIPGILYNVWEIEHEEHVVRFEIPEL
jgi:hypothetical protein